MNFTKKAMEFCLNSVIFLMRNLTSHHMEHQEGIPSHEPGSYLPLSCGLCMWVIWNWLLWRHLSEKHLLSSLLIDSVKFFTEGKECSLRAFWSFLNPMIRNRMTPVIFFLKAASLAKDLLVRYYDLKAILYYICCIIYKSVNIINRVEIDIIGMISIRSCIIQFRNYVPLIPGPIDRNLCTTHKVSPSSLFWN